MPNIPRLRICRQEPPPTNVKKQHIRISINNNPAPTIKNLFIPNAKSHKLHEQPKHHPSRHKTLKHPNKQIRQSKDMRPWLCTQPPQQWKDD